MEKIRMTDSTLGFIGLGLIGGSIARGIKRARPDIKIMAYMRSRNRLEQAKKDGVVDVILDGIDGNLRECDLIFLCTPVEYNASYLSSIRPYLKPGALITDVGSTKCGIHEEIIRQGLEDCFVGGHPMAGSEKTGYENSTDHLLENAYYIVTPPEGSAPSSAPEPSANARRIIAVAQTIGAIPLVLNYREHDKVVAAISHLPHLVASSLVNLVKDNDTAQGTMKQVAAGGFKDITRIASSSPEMWEQICMTNVGPIADILEKYIASLNQILAQVRGHCGDSIYQLFETSRDYRNSITDRAKGPWNRPMNLPWMLPMRSVLFPPYRSSWQPKASASKISASTITGNAGRAPLRLHFMTSPPWKLPGNAWTSTNTKCSACNH